MRITDINGWRLTCFATNTKGWRIADLEIRHRLRARAEDRIRGLKDTGLTNLPLQAFAKNQIWVELAQLAYELLTWTQTFAWHDQRARVWEPKRLRLRLLAVTGRIITTGRRTHSARLPAMAMGRLDHRRPPQTRRPDLNQRPAPTTKDIGEPARQPGDPTSTS